MNEIQATIDIYHENVINEMGRMLEVNEEPNWFVDYEIFLKTPTIRRKKVLAYENQRESIYQKQILPEQV